MDTRREGSGAENSRLEEHKYHQISSPSIYILKDTSPKTT